MPKKEQERTQCQKKSRRRTQMPKKEQEANTNAKKRAGTNTMPKKEQEANTRKIWGAKKKRPGGEQQYLQL